MKFLITGYKGFIGQNMRNYLHDDRQHIVDGFELNDEVGGFPNVEGYDYVIHLGAISSTTERDVEKIMDRNYDFSYKLLVACNNAKVPLQYASSASVYGPAAAVIDEEHECQPLSPYAWSKYLFDRLVLKSIPHLDIKVQGFRYFNVYGAREGHKGDQASPVTKFQNMDRITLFEKSDEYKRDFVWVNDIIKVHEKMFKVEESGIFNIGSGKAYSFEDIANAYNKPIDYIPMPLELKGQYQEFTLSNNNKLLERIGPYEFTDVIDFIKSRNI